MNMFNFVPYPNSTTPIDQQYYEYETAKFLYTFLTPLSVAIITTVIGCIVAIWYFRRLTKDE